MSLKDLMLQDALRSQKMYEDFERGVGGPAMVEALRKHHQEQEIAARYKPLLALASQVHPPSGREALFEAIRKMQEEATGVEALRRTLGAVDDRFALRELQQRSAELVTFQSSFADAVKTFHLGANAEALWREVAAIPEPWVSLEDPYRSFEAFGALCQVASVHTARADDEDDLDPRIDEIPRPAARPLGRVAGLTVREVKLRVDLGAPKDIGILVAGAGTWGTEAHVQVQGVEVMLRAHLDLHLTRISGPSWHKQYVHKEVLQSWRAKQAEARVGGSDNVLDFSTLGELRDVLVRKDVWAAISADVKMAKEEFEVVLDHLMEIRHAVDHGRPIKHRHFVWCFADVDRIYAAFGFDESEEG
jgi:hypothetical protein